ncbi:MAG TPA: CDP-archaeol synthase [Thermoproteota archaeon]|nr:CDP-archaeol synthase [Thermoproteota archaeon]
MEVLSLAALIDSTLHVYVMMLPAMLANSSAVIFSGGPVIDMGVKFIDSEPVFGKNKTTGGFLGGMLSGGLLGLLLSQGLQGFVMAAGALVGDLLGAFIKRRFKLEPGQPFPLLDQYDFVMGAMATALLFGYPLDPSGCSIFLITIPIVHFAANYLAYKSGLKRVPW